MTRFHWFFGVMFLSIQFFLCLLTDIIDNFVPAISTVFRVANRLLLLLRVFYKISEYAHFWFCFLLEVEPEFVALSQLMEKVVESFLIVAYYFSGLLETKNTVFLIVFFLVYFAPLLNSFYYRLNFAVFVMCVCFYGQIDGIMTQLYCSVLRFDFLPWKSYHVFSA